MKQNVSVKHDKIILDKVRNYTKKTKQTIGGFYDLAALEKIKFDKIAKQAIDDANSIGRAIPASDLKYFDKLKHKQ